MPYILKKSNGNTLVTVADGSIDQSTSLTFVGKNYAGYGGIIDNNLLFLLENFSNKTPPTNPLQGQLWFDSSNVNLKVYDGSNFKQLAVISTATSTPGNLQNGDFWLNPVTNQLSIKSNNVFISLSSLGGIGSSGSGSSAIFSTIKDSSNVGHLVSKTIVNSSTIYVNSADAQFTVNSTDPNYGSFKVISSGITLAGADSLGRTTSSLSSGGKFYGTAAHSLQADSLLTDSGSYNIATTSTVANSIVVRDSNGNISANLLTGTATSANSLYVNGTTVEYATTSSTANTVVARDNSGQIFASNFIGAASSVRNSLTFVDGTTYNGSVPVTVTANSLGGLTTSTFQGINQSLTVNGYQIFPGGLTMVWGKAGPYTGREGAITVNFASSGLTNGFANACLNAQATILLPYADDAADQAAQVFSMTKTTLGVYLQFMGGGNSTNGLYINWFAIGR